MSVATERRIAAPAIVPRRARHVGARTRLHLTGLVLLNAVGALAFLWPFVLPRAMGRGGEAHQGDASLVLGGLLALLAVVLFADLGRPGIGAKAVALLGTLGAAMVALRLPGFIGGFSAMFIVVLVAGNAFGPGFGFLLGAIGTFASGLFVGGIGPWLPFQMVAVGWVGLGAGLLPRAGSWRVRIGALAVYGFVAAYAFGLVMNLWHWPFLVTTGPFGFVPGAGTAANLHRYARFYAATSLGWDTAGAVGNVAMVFALGRPLLGALDRAARRMRLDIA